MEIMIGSRNITPDGQPYFIADIAANHDGDINRAFKLIELAKESGADAAKFQNFKAKTIVSRKGFDSMPKVGHQAGWHKSVYDVYEEASIEEEWTWRLKQKCDEFEIEYMTSPYDLSSVDLVNPYVNAYKIGSGDITWTEILTYIASKGKPVLLATGASDLWDVDRAIKTIQETNEKVILMQCNTNYTASKNIFNYVNLNVLKTYSRRYPNCILGLSDHTYGHTAVLGALALGARVFEKHFTDDNGRSGPDHKFSMNPKTWNDMVEAAFDLWTALGDGQKIIENNELEAHIVQQRGLYLTKNVAVGTIITNDMVFPLRPLFEDGIEPYKKDMVVGKRLIRDMEADTYIRWEDMEDA